jgi:hypothetical protein
VGGFFDLMSLRLSYYLHPLTEPTRGILKGGAYGSQEEGQKESQKEKEITFLDEGLWW